MTSWHLALQLACTLSAGPAVAGPAKCPDEAAARSEAGRGFDLRRKGALTAALDAFEAAYRCMPRDRQHEDRWENLASFLDTAQKLDASEPAEMNDRLCRARALIDEYQVSIRQVSPPPEAATYAAEERKRIEAEMARRSLDRGACGEPQPRPPEPTTAAPVARPPEASVAPAGPAATPEAVPQASTTATMAGTRAAPSVRSSRPLWIAGAVTGLASIIPLAIMGAGLRRGDQAEDAAAAAMTAGELQQIRDDIHPDGVVGNRMAYAGAIVGGVLIITSVALLTTAGRRAKARSRVAASATGLLIRF